MLENRAKKIEEAKTPTHKPAWAAITLAAVSFAFGGCAKREEGGKDLDWRVQHLVEERARNAIEVTAGQFEVNLPTLPSRPDLVSKAFKNTHPDLKVEGCFTTFYDKLEVTANRGNVWVPVPVGYIVMVQTK